MAGKYRVTMKSAEQLGASQPNIVYLSFASDGDANIFGQNISGTPLFGGGITQARNITIDKELSTNYALPYPAGTEFSGRTAWGDDSGQRMNMAFANVPAGFNAQTRVAALLAAGFQGVTGGGGLFFVPSYGNTQVFDLRPSI